MTHNPTTEDHCHFCSVEFVDGQCPECRSIKLTELWRRQDMELTAQVERDLRFAMRKDKAA